MHDREQRAAEEKKKKAETPTVRSEEEQKKYDEQQAREEQARAEKKEKEKSKRVKIRPLSDARAIELGANFFSEAFIFLVAVALLLAENYRSSRKAGQRRDEVEERLDDLEAQVERLHQEHRLPELEALNDKIKQSREARKRLSWYNPASWWRRTDPDIPDDDEGVPGEVEGSGGSGGKRIPGNVPGPPPEQAVKLKPVASVDAPIKEGTEKAKPPPAAAPPRVDTVTATKKEK
jgi:actin-related protein